MARVLILGMAAMASGCIGGGEPEAWALAEGDRAPAFEVVTLEGDTVRSSDSWEREMVIVFFNTSCGDCRRELPAIQKQYEADRLLPAGERSQYICISREEGAADVAAYWSEARLTMPVSAQETRTVYSLFASQGIPRIFKVSEGVVVEAIYP